MRKIEKVIRHTKDLGIEISSVNFSEDEGMWIVRRRDPGRLIHFHCDRMMVSHGSAIRCVDDLPVDGERVKIEFRQLRARCKSCGFILVEPIAWVSPWSRRTKRLDASIYSMIELEIDDDVVSETTMVDKNTIKRLRKSYMKGMSKCRSSGKI